MNEARERLIEILKDPEFIVRIAKGKHGICYLVYVAAPGGWVYFDATKEDAFEAWSKFSGNVGYPIPHPRIRGRKAAYSAYSASVGRAKRYRDRYWDDEDQKAYIEMRLELLDHLIHWYENLGE